MKRLTFIIIWIFIIAVAVICLPYDVRADDELTSYHISPVNSYQKIRLSTTKDNEDIDPAATSPSCAPNNTIQMSKDDRLFFCLNNEYSTPPAIWKQEGDFISLVNADKEPYDKHVGIGTTPKDPPNYSPEFKLTLDNNFNPKDDGGILAKGKKSTVSDTDDIADFSSIYPPPTTAYAMFLWYPQKAAFRALNTTNTSIYFASSNNAHYRPINFWSDAENSIGYYSTALGKDTLAGSTASFAAGEANVVKGPFSIIAGGYKNYIETNSGTTPSIDELILGSTIIGGTNNVISQINGIGPAANIIGGGGGEGTDKYTGNNIYNASMSAIMGGFENVIQSDLGTTGGTTLPNGNIENNKNSALAKTTSPDFSRTFSLIIGGQENHLLAAGQYNVIGGGHQNSVVDKDSSDPIHTPCPTSYSGIIGGQYNHIESEQSIGTCSEPEPRYSVIGGGYDMEIQDGSYSGIGGGGYIGSQGTPLNSHIKSDYSFILGGYNPKILANADHSSIASGKDTTVAGQFSSLGTGLNSSVSGHHSFMGIGDDSTISGHYSVLFAGKTIDLIGSYSFSTGYNSDCSSSYSTCYSNVNDNSNGEFSWFWGGPNDIDIKNGSARLFVWNSLSNLDIPNVGSVSDIAIINANRVGIGTADPQTTLDVAGTIRTTYFSIDIMNSIVGTNPVRVESNTLLKSFDLAEQIDASTTVEPGDVLAIDQASPEKVLKSTRPYEQGVIGVVSSAPALIFSPEGPIVGLGPTPESTQSPPMALTGRVPVKVSTENGPIKPGDLLVSSSQPGVAMRATDINQSIHAVIGKALETFNDPDSSGKILAIITLR